MSNETKHTPGPWKFMGGWVKANDGLIAYATVDENREPSRSESEQIANAALIAAAPDMELQLEANEVLIGELLATLKTAKEHLDQYRVYSEEMRKIGRGCMISSPFSEVWTDRMIEVTIAKAEGRDK